MNPGTVKLGIKELLSKEQTEFKELFANYQPFYIINLLLNKKSFANLRNAISEHEIVKISKKRDQFWDFTLARVPEICDQRIL